MQVYFVIDNRELDTRDFNIESNSFSLQEFITQEISKFLVLAQKFPKWITKPSILLATSPEKVQLYKPTEYSVSNIKSLLSPRFPCIGINKVSQTWNSYFLDALSKIESIHASSLVKKTLVVLISNDLHLFKSQFGAIIAFSSSIKSFIRSWNSSPITNLITTRILCPIVSESPGSCRIMEAQRDERVLFLQSELGIGSNFSFSLFLNTSLHLSEEFRQLYSDLVPSLSVQLDLPPCDGLLCSLSLSLFPTTFQSADYVHEGLSRLRLVAMAEREGIAAAHILGQSFLVLKPSLGPKQPPTHNWRHNRLLFCRLLAHLSSSNKVLILSSTHSFSPSPSISSSSTSSSSEDGYVEYWALVPPPAPTPAPLPRTFTGTSSSTFSSLPSPSSPFSSDSFTLLRLVDRDSLLAPPEDQTQGEREGGGSDDEGEGDSEELEAIDSYFQSLSHSLQPSVSFNPFACFSGYLDSLIHQALHKPSHPIPLSNSTPLSHHYRGKPIPPSSSPLSPPPPSHSAGQLHPYPPPYPPPLPVPSPSPYSVSSSFSPYPKDQSHRPLPLSSKKNLPKPTSLDSSKTIAKKGGKERINREAKPSSISKGTSFLIDEMDDIDDIDFEL